MSRLESVPEASKSSKISPLRDCSLLAVGGKVETIEEYDVANNTWSIFEENQGGTPQGGFLMTKDHLVSDEK